ncbi:hypothetical protein GCM10009559_66410 [Pseudonocardia zijingensis]|uniref:FXSXX-COOH protein n=1 Tax=Pseudonocardia zijingensis TaxID=153376 RepID=A0ABP3YNP2_9PSEU
MEPPERVPPVRHDQPRTRLTSPPKVDLGLNALQGGARLEVALMRVADLRPTIGRRLASTAAVPRPDRVVDEDNRIGRWSP